MSQDNTRDDIRDDTQDTQNSESEIIRLGKDEMNLIEHPFGSLSKEKDTRIIELFWKTEHPKSKKILDAYWKVRGDADLGLPTANDEKIYLVAMELTRESGWTREVHFTRADFLRRLGWSNNDEGYRRLHEGFMRLAGVLIEAKNAFYHPKSEHYINGGFHMIDTFMIAGEGPGTKGEAGLSKPPTFFVWNQIVHDSFIAGNIRSINLHFALNLDLPLSLRLFRYLDKKRYGDRHTFEVGLKELCGTHLGMVVEGRYDSNLKASLKGAHTELIARGFLAGVEFEQMKTRKGAKVMYAFASTQGAPALSLPAALLPQLPSEVPSESEPPAPDEDEDGQVRLLMPNGASAPAFTAPFPALGGADLPLSTALVASAAALPAHTPRAASLVANPQDRAALTARLVAVGVSATVARELCQKFPPEQIEVQLDCLGDRDPKSPAGALVKAIRQCWGLPPKYLERQRASEQEQQIRASRQAAERSQATQKAAEQQKAADQDAEAMRLDALWETLDVPTRQRIASEAKKRLGVLGRAGTAQAAQAAMQRNLLREMLSSVLS